MSTTEGTIPTPTIDELTARAGAIEGAWIAEQELDTGLPEADLVLEAWFRTEHFAAADLSAQVGHAVLAEGAGGTAAIAVHVEVFDHDDVWTITLLFAQDATRAVLVGVPSEPLEMGPLETLLGTSQALPFTIYRDDFVLGHGAMRARAAPDRGARRRQHVPCATRVPSGCSSRRSRAPMRAGSHRRRRREATPFAARRRRAGAPRSFACSS